MQMRVRNSVVARVQPSAAHVHLLQPCVCDYADESVQLPDHACATMPGRVCTSAVAHPSLCCREYATSWLCMYDYMDEKVQLCGHACATMPTIVCNSTSRELIRRECVAYKSCIQKKQDDMSSIQEKKNRMHPGIMSNI